jgi:hypothetical protein
MFELLGRYVPIDFAVAIIMIHCGESIAYNVSIEISRVGSVLACQISRMTALCPQSRDEITCFDLRSCLKSKPWPCCHSVRLLKVSFLVEQESQLLSRHVTMKQNVPATYFQIKYVRCLFVHNPFISS